MRALKLTTLIAPFALLLTFAGNRALAERGGGPGGGACRQDVEALCPSVTPGPGSFHYCLGQLCPDIGPGPGGFAACLQKYSSKLSAACQQELSDVQAKMAAWKQAFQQACGGDIQSFCVDAGTERGAVFKCLHEHKDELSQTCKDQLKSHHGWHHDRCAGPTPAS